MAASCRYCLTTLVLLATSPAVAQQQDASGEHLVGCYSVDVADGQDLPLNYTSPPRLVRLDLLRDVRTGAEYSYVASAMYDGPHFLGLDRSWTVKNAYTVEVNWNSAFWGVQVRFPARREGGSGVGRSWSDIGRDVVFIVQVEPFGCETTEWVQEWPAQVFPRFNAEESDEESVNQKGSSF
jgi:hypothetical protein